ncbi:zona pellucida sperm-binding protein 4-like [Polypterus senegalus]|uniref:zona pellucida sperm-binding protein 4-like n=1 Tax=Polypterus senegalus TaxID=55291 RepID=UPI001962AF8A|nr:zona pellucida sperm-binding protein 4-like [Polypterus senegalus]
MVPFVFRSVVWTAVCLLVVQCQQPATKICTNEGMDLKFPGRASENRLCVSTVKNPCILVKGLQGFRLFRDGDLLVVRVDRHSPYVNRHGSSYSVTLKTTSSAPAKIYMCQQVSRSVVSDGECAVADSEKVPCGGDAVVGQADCEAENCCYDSSSSSTSSCYYGNTVTVQCNPNGQFVVVVSRNVTVPPLDLGSVRLLDNSSPSCSPVTSTSNFALYQFSVSECGTLVKTVGGNVSYENVMSAAISVTNGPQGSITRDSIYKLSFQCSYSGDQNVNVEVGVYTVTPPLPVVEQGLMDLELRIAKDSSYSSYYGDADYPVTRVLRDPVDVEVRIVNRSDPNLVLTLGNCWVTPGPSASNQPQWSLLVNGCPYLGDDYLTSLINVDATSGVAYPSHYKRFEFKMFAFVSASQQGLSQMVYIFCSAAVCYPSAVDSCVQSCPKTRSGRDVDQNVKANAYRKNVLVHSGPVFLTVPDTQTSKLQGKAPGTTGYTIFGATAGILMVILTLAVLAKRKLCSQEQK